MITAEGYSKDPTIIPDGIAITFPVQFLLDIAPKMDCVTQMNRSDGSIRTRYNTERQRLLAGYKKCLQEIEFVMAKPDERWWWHSIGSKPQHETLYAYIIILNRVKYRATIIGWEPGGTKDFSDGRKISAKHWLQLADFKPNPHYIPMKGFQGFRYTTKLF